MDKSKTAWTPLATILLGLVLFSAPHTFAYPSEVLRTNDQICGVLLIVFGLLFRTQQRIWAHWATALLGCWLQFAPLLFWAPDAAVYLNETFIGILAILFSVILPHIDSPPNEGPSIPPGWSFNPSTWSQRLIIAVLASICWLLSRMMASYQLGYIDHVWAPFFGDGTIRVITSSVSHAFPVPDAGLGAMCYTLEVLLTCYGGERRWRTSPWIVVLYGIMVVPVSIVSIILIILQPIAVGAWCSPCLFVAASMLLMIPLALSEVAAVLQYLRHSHEKPLWRLFFFGGLCPGAKESKSPPFHTANFKEHRDNILSGITLPWNLLITALLGIWLMFSPWLFPSNDLFANIDHILGPLITVISIASLAEVARHMRRLNQVFALLLLVSAIFAYPQYPVSLINHLITSLLLFFLSQRKGPTKEKFKFNN